MEQRGRCWTWLGLSGRVLLNEFAPSVSLTSREDAAARER